MEIRNTLKWNKMNTLYLLIYYKINKVLFFFYYLLIYSQFSFDNTLRVFNNKHSKIITKNSGKYEINPS